MAIGSEWSRVVTIGVNPAGLLAGTYSGSVLVEVAGRIEQPIGSSREPGRSRITRVRYFAEFGGIHGAPGAKPAGFEYDQSYDGPKPGGGGFRIGRHGFHVAYRDANERDNPHGGDRNGGSHWATSGKLFGLHHRFFQRQASPDDSSESDGSEHTHPYHIASLPRVQLLARRKQSVPGEPLHRAIRSGYSRDSHAQRSMDFRESFHAFDLRADRRDC